jgi:hypothetical protein
MVSAVYLGQNRVMAVWSDRSSGRNPPSTILVGAPLLLGQGFRGLLVAAALAERAHRLPLLSPRGASSASVRRRNLDKGLFDCLQGELEACEKPPGLSMSDLLTLPEPLGGVLNWMLRQEVVTFAEVMAFLAQEEEQTRAHSPICTTRDSCAKSRFEA